MSFSLWIDKDKDNISINNTGEIKQLSGNFCYDFYRYLKNNEKRFYIENIKSIEISPLFNYYDLDYLKSLDINKVLEKTDDELYQIYIKEYKLLYPTAKVSSYFIWILENKCYLIETLIHKLNKIYKNFNPFKRDIYILNSKIFLYNNNLIKIYGSISIDYDIKERKNYFIPMNEYRIINRNELTL